LDFGSALASSIIRAHLSKIRDTKRYERHLSTVLFRATMWKTRERPHLGTGRKIWPFGAKTNRGAQVAMPAGRRWQAGLPGLGCMEFGGEVVGAELGSGDAILQ